MGVFFPQIGQYGRLGNQLFQYAAGRSLALSHNTNLYMFDPSSLEWHGQKCLLDNFNIKVKHMSQKRSNLHGEEFGKWVPRSPTMDWTTWHEPNPFVVEKDFFNLPNNITINGFFQSTYYFKPYEEIIKKELTPLKNTSDRVEEIRNSTGKEVVSIHVRRGDNTDWTDPAQRKLRAMYDEDGVYTRYVRKAISTFKDVQFLVFTGGARGAADNSEDIAWCKNFFQGKKFMFAEGGSSLSDFSDIMSCDHNIIGHVSSFGWWAAFLNSNPNKVVVAPKNYHPDIPNFTHRFMFYPEDWILI